MASNVTLLPTNEKWYAHFGNLSRDNGVVIESSAYFPVIFWIVTTDATGMKVDAVVSFVGNPLSVSSLDDGEKREFLGYLSEDEIQE